MNFEIITMAYHALLSNKVRSLLSMLGIIIGVSTVIAVVGIGLGAQKQVEEQFKNLSATTIMAIPSRGGAGSSRLSEDDLSFVLSESTLIKDGTVIVQGNAEVSAFGNSGSFSATGTLPDFFDYASLTFAAGKAYEEEDLLSRNNVVVIGDTVAQELFEEGYDPQSLIGQIITVARKKMEIIGVLDVNGGTGRLSYDDAVFLPTATVKRIVGNRGSLRLMFNAYSVDEIKIAEEEVVDLLRKNHRLREGKDNDFRIFDPGSIVSSAQESSKTLTFLLAAVSIIVLIVSGIGIMNVMFVTVAERTREIGILKAIGAQQKDILAQFLLEAIMLSVTGGLIGILIGNSVIPFLKEYQAAYSLSAILLGFGFSVLVGIFFGFYPALKASRLDPVDALRSE